MGIYNQIIESKKEGRKLFSILIDPDKQTEESLLQIIKKSKSSNVDFIKDIFVPEFILEESGEIDIRFKTNTLKSYYFKVKDFYLAYVCK